MHVVVIGDCLLDTDLHGHATRLAPDAPVPILADIVKHHRPGGAGLAALLGVKRGVSVDLVTAIADDRAGRHLRKMLTRAGVSVVDIGTSSGRTPQRTRVRSGDVPLLRFDRESSTPVLINDLTSDLHTLFESADAVLVSDYGHGITAHPSIRALLNTVSTRIPTVWDPHPRGAVPVSGCMAVTPNALEAAHFREGQPPYTRPSSLTELGESARELAAIWQVGSVAVTAGEFGAIMCDAVGPPIACPATFVYHGDTCGAGDRFAVEFAVQLGRGQSPQQALVCAVDATANWLRAGGVQDALDAPDAKHVRVQDTSASIDGFVGRVRLHGGRVVAAGGCFDLLHAGHVSMLKRARSLGDCLIVFINSDDSVRRIKGSGRPVVTQDDRAAILEALSCVDAVLSFEDDIPADLLQRFKPDIFVKGADYSPNDVPEGRLLTDWGGQLVLLPLLVGRSTTGVVLSIAS